MTSTRRENGVAFALLVGLFLCLPILIWSLPLTTDGDLYLHLKTGELAWQAKHPLIQDVFSFSDAGRPDEAHSWLSQILFFLVHRAWGETGLRALATVLLLAVFSLAARFSWKRTRDGRTVAVGCGLAFLLHLNYVSIRPLLFGEALFAVTVFWLLESTERLSPQKLLVATAIAIAWPNLHGSAVLLPVLFAIHAAAVTQREGRVGVWTFLPLGIAGLTFLNAMGPGLYGYTWELARLAKASGITEWQGAPFLRASPNPLPGSGGILLEISLAHRHLPFLIAIFLAAFTARDRRPLPEKILANGLSAFFLALAVISVRHAPFVAYAIVALTAVVRWRPAVQWAAIAVAAFGILASDFTRGGLPQADVRNATQFLLDSGISGNALNHPSFGSYLIYRTYPSLRVATDRRTWLHRRYYESEARQKRELGAISLSQLVELFPESDFLIWPSTADVAQMMPGEKWVTVYENNHAVIALRKTARFAENLARVQHYYREQGIAFDATRGFDVRTVASAHSEWFHEQIEKDGFARWTASAARRIWLEKEAQYFERHGIHADLSSVFR